MSSEPTYGRFGSGKSVRRLEDPTLVTGTGRYVDDVELPGQTHLVFVRSQYAHAKINSVDSSAALEMPGVIAVFSGADLVAAGVNPLPAQGMFKRPDGSAPTSPPRRAIAHEVTRFVGEPVAAVIAQTREQAKAASEAVYVDYEELPVVADLNGALAADAPLVWEPAGSNVVARNNHGDKAASDAAFAKAAHVVSMHIENQRLAPAPMEPRGVLADFDEKSGRITITMSTQMPTGVRNTLCDEILKIPKESVRVTVGDVGGGFGMKTGIYPEDAAVAWCARELRRPVKWIAERGEEFLSAVHGRGMQSDAELALDAQGKILALRVRTQANVGAYATPTGCAIQLLIGPWVSTSIYDIPAIDFTLDAVITNNAPTGAYRGAGRPEAIYNIERLLDLAARRTGIAQQEIRRRNMISPAQMPYRNAMGQTYDSGQFESVMNQGLKLADWDGFEARAAESKARGKLRGRGIATFLEWTGGNALEERVTLTVSGDGYIEIFSATQAMGQGIVTTYAQLAVDVFGVPIDKIRVLQGDTDRGTGFGSAGSRSLFTGGSAVKAASVKAVDAARQMAADALEASAEDLEYADGKFRIAGTDREMDLFEVAGRQPDGRVYIDSTTAVQAPSWPNGCHIAEVEVDPDTGVVEVIDYASVNDVGRVVNPMIVRGQLEGGAVQGIGQALCEQIVYDPQSGQCLTASFLDYTLPRVDAAATRFKTELDESTPCLTNPLGVKGVGELGTIGATPTVVNAVVDALDRAGRLEQALQMQMPLTPERVWQALSGSAS
ncbi:MAG: xanthine dehydrogenase family protein molybdopterin-binding subunit [Quisquiliibacterium sp.]